MDASIDRYYSLRPLAFPVLDELAVTQSVMENGASLRLNLTVRLRSNNPLHEKALMLTFHGVVELSLQMPRISQVLLPLTVRSIRDWQWDSLNYEVNESEDDILSFFCESFDAMMVDIPD